MSHPSWDRVGIDAQSVDAPLSRSAVFLTMTIGPTDAALDIARSVIAGIDDLVKTVGFRDLDGRLSCVVGIGDAAWDRLSPRSRPKELHAFAEIDGGVHRAPATPGDLLFHIRAERADLCFEFERLLLDALGESVAVVDEVTGFRYFDSRDLLGFVDGTANPVADELIDSAVIGDEDPDFAGGSYVVVQKYLHDLAAWGEVGTAVQEEIIGRSKSDNVERASATEARKSHKSLSTIVDDDGNELDILRDNMPFGRPGQGEFGTYFIGYSRRLWVTEKMLHNMFLGDPIGSYDRILDFSTPVTGATFFVPSRQYLADLGESQPVTPVTSAPSMQATEAEAPVPLPADEDTSLRIGSLKTPQSEGHRP